MRIHTWKEKVRSSAVQEAMPRPHRLRQKRSPFVTWRESNEEPREGESHARFGEGPPETGQGSPPSAASASGGVRRVAAALLRPHSPGELSAIDAILNDPRLVAQNEHTTREHDLALEKRREFLYSDVQRHILDIDIAIGRIRGIGVDQSRRRHLALWVSERPEEAPCPLMMEGSAQGRALQPEPERR